jgi:uncharacterized protein
MSDTQLIEAVKAGGLASVNELIESSADVNQQDEHGWTPLNWAAGRGDLEMVKLLVSRGGDLFKVGRDQRTPYMIALAAGRVEVVKFLREAEDQFEGEKRPRPERKYCKAYHLRDLRQFTGWSESRINWKTVSGDNGRNDKQGEVAAAEVFTDDDIVFIHQDYTVTQSMWHNENVIYNRVGPDWEEFCQAALSFKVPDDLDLIGVISSPADSAAASGS